jgi:iron-sulfur cluster assembly protein
VCLTGTAALVRPRLDWRHIILTLTEQAASMIRELLDHADLPDSAGLRIAQRDDHTALAMTLADEPSPDDLVIAERDVAVFLGPMAARRVQAQTLDANTTDTSTAFYLRD